MEARDARGLFSYELPSAGVNDTTVPAFDLPTHIEAHAAYHQRRNRPNGLRAPRVVESAMSLALAERCRVEGDIRQARAMLAFAVENSLGDAVLAALERRFDAGRPIDWRPALFPLTAPPPTTIPSIR